MNEPRKPSRRSGNPRPGGRSGGRPGGGQGGGGYGKPRGAGRFERTGPGRPRPSGDRPGGRTTSRDAAREATIRALSLQAKRFPDLSLEGVETRGLGSRDAALAVAIHNAALRRWMTLQHLIEARCDIPWLKLHPGVRATLLTGLAQMALLDRIPQHAAVATSVDYAKAKISIQSGRLVNAVLRRMTELITEERREQPTDALDELPMSNGTALVLADEVLPEDPMQRLSIATSTPLDLLRSWSRDMGMRSARLLAMHGLAEPPIILNTSFATGDLPEGCTPHSAPGHHVWKGEHEALVTLLNERRDLWVQDPASSLAVGSVTDLSPELIIDACAGLGTKTRQLAAAFPGATIVASDVDKPRRKALREAFADEPRVKVIADSELSHFTGRADLVVLDVPCSNTGVLARRVEARYRADAERERGLVTTQRQIIADAIPLLRSEGGRGSILYSTCSLSRAENEENARWAAKWHSMDIDREHRREPSGQPGGDPASYSDGSYAVLLK